MKKHTAIILTLAQIAGWSAVVLEFQASIADGQWKRSDVVRRLECAAVCELGNCGQNTSDSMGFTTSYTILFLLITFANILWVAKNRQWSLPNSAATKLNCIVSGVMLFNASIMVWAYTYEMDKKYKANAAVMQDANITANCDAKQRNAMARIYMACYNQSIFYHGDIPFFLAAQGYEPYSTEAEHVESHNLVDTLQNALSYLSTPKNLSDMDPSVTFHDQEYRFSSLKALGFCQQEKKKLIASALAALSGLLYWLSLWTPCCCQKFEDDEDEPDEEIYETVTEIPYLDPPTATSMQLTAGEDAGDVVANNEFQMMEKASFICQNGDGVLLNFYCPHHSPTICNQFRPNFSSWSNFHTVVAEMNARSSRSFPIVRVKKGLEASVIAKDNFGLY